MFNHYMLDIETLGTGDNAAMMSLAIVAFDPHKGLESAMLLDSADRHVTPYFYTHIDPQSLNLGELDAETVRWWMTQSDTARTSLFDSNGHQELSSALMKLTIWLQQRGVRRLDHESPQRLWSKSPIFDERILRQAYTRCGLAFPFHRRTTRDMRTLYDVAGEVGIGDIRPEAGPDVTKHNALHDAQSQALEVCRIYRGMDSLKS